MYNETIGTNEPKWINRFKSTQAFAQNQWLRISLILIKKILIRILQITNKFFQAI